MATLKDLIKQQEALAKQIEELRVTEKEEAIGKVFVLINEYGLTQEDLYGSRKGRNVFAEKSTRAKVLAKYRDPKTGAEWTGRGRTPVWLNGKNRDDFLIDKSAAVPVAAPK
jgi:DNA-binding protein H-NS